MLKGLPASRKSSWAKEQVAKGGYLRVSMDDIRASAFGGWSVKKEKACLRLRDEMVRFGIKEGKNVIVDATNLNPKHEYRLRRLAEELGVKFEINDSFLKRTPEQCIQDDLHRGEDAVGANIIWEMWEKWVRPNPEKLLEKNADKRRCILLDLDGSLCKRVTDRSYYDMTRVNEDIPNPFISFLADCISESGEYYADLVIITGRTEDGRELTEKWLKDNCIDYKALYMRKVGDKRKDFEVKEEIIRDQIAPKYAILGAIDNSLRCCSTYYEMGIETLRCGNPLGEH